ncbi:MULTISPECIES: non-ribosomal peptide synthetase [unclassified Leptolyngbya]|uniref:non-ribosomal peptide synthetase n=1 Tax=unclassified Leptolyngbya TaxID=2650499 RepID=UPI00168344A9|nr:MULTISPECIES: non-ribosomal peptide synthetase [unclassified Leptolyngbya]MBD1911608.1 amino acid adenylation domain-containing protein [Leptolyngbya sp. FACHB-8]MBD2155219.1 amino acid adenylation domain-containing protein [Leptolyngbya sp. FACHB-16]
MSFKSVLDALDSSVQQVESSPSPRTESQPTSLQERPGLQLPYDYLKTAATSYNPEQVQFTLPSTLPKFLSEQLIQGIHPDSIVLAALSALLYRYTRQTLINLDVLALSYHKTTLPPLGLTTSVSSLASLRSLVQNLSVALSDPESGLESLENQSRSNIVVSFDTADFTGKLTTEAPDLHLHVQSAPERIQGTLRYNANLFERSTIERCAGHLNQLIEGLIGDPDQTVADLALLTADETHQLLVDWASPAVEYPQKPIFTVIEAHAAQRPEAIALTFTNQHLTYAELNQRANQLAHHLRTLGVGPEVRVATCLEPGLEVLVGVLAIHKAGGVYVPLDPSHPLERRTAILEDTEPLMLLTQERLLGNVPAIAQHTFCLDRDWETVASQPTHNPNYPIDLDQTAYIIYTSGTTGKPKGVMASHQNLINYIWVAQEKYGFNDQDVMPSIARYTFSITMFELWSPLVAGGRLLLLERDHILDFKRMIQTLEEVTIIHTSPSLLRKLVNYIHDNQLDLNRFQQLRHVSSGGDMVAADLLEMMKQTFTNAEVFVIYGCSEISCMGCTYFTPRDGSPTKTRVGKPFPNVSVRLFDPDYNLVPVGIPGEIFFGGAGINKGYLNRDELTAERFVMIGGQRYYRTGDLGRFDTDGNLEILGRADFQIKLRGIRMEPAEIEATLRQVAGVREAVVAAQTLPGNEEKSLIAYLVLEADNKPTTQQIRRFLEAKLPDYMVPTIYKELDAMPLNVNGKVDRLNLPVPTLADLVDASAYVAPRDELESQLAEIWETVLGISPIGIRNNFFEMGGDSLMAVQILMQIETVFNKTLSITAPLQAPTIEEMAELIRNFKGSIANTGLVPLRKEGSKPPLFCLYGVLLYRDLVEHLDPDQPVYGVYLEEEVEILKAGPGWQDDPKFAHFSTVPAIAQQYLKAVRSLQPHGPYYFAGESFGGVIAYEMAQQLEAEGEEVALIALLDSKAPNSYAQASLKHRLKKHLEMATQQGPSYLADKIQGTLNKFKGKVKLPAHSKTNEGVQPASPPSTDVPSDVREAFRAQVSRYYFLTPYKGNVILFRAMDRDPFEVDPNQDMGWGSYVDRLEVVHIPGNHLGILRTPNVRMMAEHLTPYLPQ